MGAGQDTLDMLVDRLSAAQVAWDDAYVQVLEEWPDGLKQTEDRVKIAVRNEVRRRHAELPELVRWRLRAALGYRSDED